MIYWSHEDNIEIITTNLNYVGINLFLHDEGVEQSSFLKNINTSLYQGLFLFFSPARNSFFLSVGIKSPFSFFLFSFFFFFKIKFQVRFFFLNFFHLFYFFLSIIPNQLNWSRSDKSTMTKILLLFFAV